VVGVGGGDPGEVGEVRDSIDLLTPPLGDSRGGPPFLRILLIIPPRHNIEGSTGEVDETFLAALFLAEALEGLGVRAVGLLMDLALPSLVLAHRQHVCQRHLLDHLVHVLVLAVEVDVDADLVEVPGNVSLHHLPFLLREIRHHIVEPSSTFEGVVFLLVLV